VGGSTGLVPESKGLNNMANMSYCRFENTLRDLDDCKFALEDLKPHGGDDELSDTEARAKKQLLQTCIAILSASIEVSDPDLDKEELRCLARDIKEFLR
jgi:hypothetical protein